MKSLEALVVWRRCVMEHRHICLFFFFIMFFSSSSWRKKKKYIDEGTFWLLLLMFQTLEGIDERSSLSPLQKKNIYPPKKRRINPPHSCQLALPKKSRKGLSDFKHKRSQSSVYQRERGRERKVIQPIWRQPGGACTKITIFFVLRRQERPAYSVQSGIQCQQFKKIEKIIIRKKKRVYVYITRAWTTN